MYLSTLDSLVGFLWWVLSESLRLPPWGFFLFCPLWAVLRRFIAVVVTCDTPIPLTPLYGPSVALWRGFISFAVPLRGFSVAFLLRPQPLRLILALGICCQRQYLQAE